jgi:hypothetical protein
VPPGRTAAAAFNHLSLLRTTEELLALPALAGARRAQSMRRAFNLG